MAAVPSLIPSMLFEEDLPRDLTYPRFRSLYAEKAPSSLRSATGAVKKTVIADAWKRYKGRMVTPMRVYPVVTLLGLPVELVRMVGRQRRCVFGLMRRACRRLREMLNADLVERLREDVSVGEIVTYLMRVVPNVLTGRSTTLLGCILVYDTMVEQHEFRVRSSDVSGVVTLTMTHKTETYSLFRDGENVRAETRLVRRICPALPGVIGVVMGALRYRTGRLLVCREYLGGILLARNNSSGEYRDARAIDRVIEHHDLKYTEMVRRVCDVVPSRMEDIQIFARALMHRDRTMHAVALLVYDSGGGCELRGDRHPEMAGSNEYRIREVRMIAGTSVLVHLIQTRVGRIEWVLEDILRGSLGALERGLEMPVIPVVDYDAMYEP